MIGLRKGYILYRVNGAYYLSYATARKRRVAEQGSVFFTGLHVVRGWECFYSRVGSQP